MTNQSHTLWYHLKQNKKWLADEGFSTLIKRERILIVQMRPKLRARGGTCFATEHTTLSSGRGLTFLCSLGLICREKQDNKKPSVAKVRFERFL
jgi:hypothetical protein